MKACPKCAERSGPGEVVAPLNSAGYCHKCGHDDEKPVAPPVEEASEADESNLLAAATMRIEKVNHPAHYGGAGNTYEVINVIEAWGLGFCLGNAIKYIARAGRKTTEPKIDDLKKALWYLQRAIDQNGDAHEH